MDGPRERLGRQWPEIGQTYPGTILLGPSSPLGIGSCREKPFGLYGSAEIVKWRITEIPDQHYTSMRFRDWFAPVTVIALET